MTPWLKIVSLAARWCNGVNVLMVASNWPVRSNKFEHIFSLIGIKIWVYVSFKTSCTKLKQEHSKAINLRDRGKQFYRSIFFKSI